MSKLSASQSYGIRSYCLFVPLQADPRNIWYVELTVFNVVRSLQDVVLRPVLPFKPVRGLRYSHNVSRYFRIQVG